MGLLSTIVGGAFGLFGANKARKDEQAAIDRQNAYNDPKAIRARAEEAGFNPLLFVGPGVGNQTAVGGTNYMGAAIADAGLMVADQLSKNSAAQKLERTERLNSKLQQQVTDLTIRPKVGGIYDQRVATPTVRQALGVPDATSIETNPFDIKGVSPLAGDASYPEPDGITGPQSAVKQDVPAFRLFGHDFYGSGLFSTGQQFEDALGEGPVQWAMQPVIMGDAILNEAFKGTKGWKDELSANRATLKALDEKRKGPKTYIPSDYKGKYPAGKRGPQRGAY